jgi:hypothetical protein
MTEQYDNSLWKLFGKALKSKLLEILKEGMKNPAQDEFKLKTVGGEYLRILRLRTREDEKILQEIKERYKDIDVYDAVADIINSRNFATKTPEGRREVSEEFEKYRKDWTENILRDLRY